MPLLEEEFIAIDEIAQGVDLVAAVRELNDSGVKKPWAWVLASNWEELGEGEIRSSMMFGVNNDRGILAWRQGWEASVPTIGVGTEWTTVYLGGMYDSSAQPGSDVPIEIVYQAVEEYLATRERPTCVEWRRGEIAPRRR
ncbi:immunity protein Imm1 of predicted polymorphic toxin system [Actinokineospora auranticolor]|uniref:Immunity protein Imm1 of predicted polymorphic toxin system n=2 Tax=Actinokineospora auranticolor TaxID=155976 RepID=A0A2S6GL75_9PSEU|nr:immunity protein Imm1 of predicted polymorphic toxin system [Actinokineospora auranticolor]